MFPFNIVTSAEMIGGLQQMGGIEDMRNVEAIKLQHPLYCVPSLPLCDDVLNALLF